ncbi:glycoside hydrolase [Boletus reticuloceps]|uniref:endo-polygalacturonase n=1 Tax=Boletus reticuloceps TaxID=495285 RepID=A0A8I3AAC1_9AGAM|nr:glycoside hydrolase [Boletus reticuloceps]
MGRWWTFLLGWSRNKWGVTKPRPMMKIEISGTLSDVHVVNAPAQCFSLTNPGPLVVSGIIVDDSQGNYPNANSNGLPAGAWNHFLVALKNFVDSSCIQDDCLAINRGQNIVFQDNYCNGGHGISIGSITSNVVVEGVVVRSNTVVNSQQAFRIKTDEVATNSSVSNVTYTDNVATNCTSYGVLITQSYPASLGTPGNGVIISDVDFYPGSTFLTAASNAVMVAVNCGEGSCIGTWNWSGLQTSGGMVGPMNNITVITGYTQ